MDAATPPGPTAASGAPSSGAPSPGAPDADGPDESATVPREHHLTTTRAARYFVLGTPSPLVRECWLVLHGYGQLAGRFLRHFADAATPERLIVAPEALSRFYVGNDVSAHAQMRVGASWMTREDRLAEISDYVGFLDSVWARVAEGIDGAAVTLGVLGFSQGAATASRWAVLGSAPVRRLVLWGGVMPDDLPLDSLRGRLDGVPVTYVLGDSDQFRDAPRMAAQLERLRAHDVPTTLREFVGGHHMDAAVAGRVLAGFGGAT